MPTPLASPGPLVHPHQLEVQDFDSYDLVIDARSSAEYDEDHIPGAKHLPADAASAPALADPVRKLAPGAHVLVYCSLGGVDSLVWAEPLRRLGFMVDVLGGGWPNYRRWVDAGLESLSRSLRFKRLQGAPLGGVQQVLTAFEARGRQVLDLADIAGQRCIPGLPWPGEAAPSQPAFETLLLDAMRHVDPEQDFWVGDCLISLGKLRLPAPLREAMQRSPGVAVSTPLAERVRYWRSTAQETSVTKIAECLGALACDPHTGLMVRCQRQLASDQMASTGADPMTALIEQHIDLCYAPLSTMMPCELLHLDSLDPLGVSAEVDAWLASRTGVLIALAPQINP